MYEDKLREARFFVERMREVSRSRDPWPFTCYFRAFLAAMRSCTAYAQSAAATRGRKAEWYKLHDSDPLRTFLRDLRDENLHVAPVRPAREVSVEVAITCYGVLDVRAASSETPDLRVRVPAVVAVRDHVSYQLQTWPGPGSKDALPLCERYVASVEQLLAAAVAARVIAR